MNTVAENQVATGTKVVQARNVSKIFRREAFEVKALDDVSIDIAAGEFMALMGPSGSGKTTLLNMIAAIDRPTSGELLVQNQNIFRFNDSQAAHWRNEHIGYVFQTFNLIPVLTAFENVELPLLLTRLNPQQRRDHVMTALKLVGLEERVNHLPKQLSGGQEQRVAIHGRPGQSLGNRGVGDSEAPERRLSQDNCDGDARSARSFVRARDAASGKGDAAATGIVLDFRLPNFCLLNFRLMHFGLLPGWCRQLRCQLRP
jgi:predicted ABC-type transport system involved in lysophospholipase L1 biosynthesis ATPase subunit